MMWRALLVLSLGVMRASGIHAEPLAVGPVISAVGSYRATLSCDFMPPVLNRFQACAIQLAATDGANSLPDHIAVAARVPGLGRIMPTAPRARGPLSQGVYRIEGLKFDMAGRWRIELEIDAGAIHDRAGFDIDIK